MRAAQLHVGWSRHSNELRIQRPFQNPSMFTRPLIRLRWTMAVAAGTVAIAMLASGWLFVSVNISMGEGQGRFCASIWGGRLSLERDRMRDNADFELEAPEWFQYKEWWAFGSETASGGSLVPEPWQTVSVPLWIVVLPAAGLAIMGFRATRRQSQGRCCQKCNHPLKGASACPECGRAAPSN